MSGSLTYTNSLGRKNERWEVYTPCLTFKVKGPKEVGKGLRSSFHKKVSLAFSLHSSSDRVLDMGYYILRYLRAVPWHSRKWKCDSFLETLNCWELKPYSFWRENPGWRAADKGLFDSTICAMRVAVKPVRMCVSCTVQCICTVSAFGSEETPMHFKSSQFGLVGEFLGYLGFYLFIKKQQQKLSP